MYQSLLIDLSIDVLDIDIMNLLTYTAMHAIYSIMTYQWSYFIYIRLSLNSASLNLL